MLSETWEWPLMTLSGKLYFVGHKPNINNSFNDNVFIFEELNFHDEKNNWVLKLHRLETTDLWSNPLRCVCLLSLTSSYPFVVNATDASVKVWQMCQQGLDGSQSVRIGLQDLLHSSLSLQDAPVDPKVEGSRMILNEWVSERLLVW